MNAPTTTGLRAVRFTFDTPEAFAGFTDDSHWNGFLNVRVTPETLDEIIGLFADLEARGLEEPHIASDRDYWPAVGPDGLVDLSNGFATVEAPWIGGQTGPSVDAMIAAELPELAKRGLTLLPGGEVVRLDDPRVSR